MNETAEDRRQALLHVLQERLARDGSGFVFPAEYLALEARMRAFTAQGGGQIYSMPSQGVNTNVTRIDGREFVNYASYNYLGLCGHPAVSQAAKDAIDRYGTSVSASRVASGERPIHRELELAIAEFLGVEDALVFVGGFATNETIMARLGGAGDLILHDSLIHASIQSGCAQSAAATRPFPHNNWQALDQILAQERSKHRQALIVIEGAYSMDGDIPDLPRFVEVKKRHGALLMIDEAHSLGVLGRCGGGIGEHFAAARGAVEVWMGTLSKAFASCGGYVAGDARLVEYLRYTAPGFVYSVGMPPASAAAALAALRVLRAEPERVARLRERSQLFLELAKASGLDTGASRDSAIIPILLGDSRACVRLFRTLFDAGILALPIMYPAVPENAARLRFFLSCLHTEPQIRQTVDLLARSH